MGWGIRRKRRVKRSGGKGEEEREGGGGREGAEGKSGKRTDGRAREGRELREDAGHEAKARKNYQQL